MSAEPPRPARSMFGVPTHGKLFFELFLGFSPSAASRHCEERSNPDIQQAPRGMSSLRGLVRWLGIYASRSRFVILSFSLEKKTNFAQAERRVELARTMLRQSKISEAKSSRPTSWAHRTWRTPLPHVGRASPPYPVYLWHSHTRKTFL